MFVKLMSGFTISHVKTEIYNMYLIHLKIINAYVLP